MYPLLFIGLYYTFIFDFWQLPNANLALTLSLPFYILRHQTVQYPTVKNNADLEFLSTPQYKVRNSSYEFAVLRKNKILRAFERF